MDNRIRVNIESLDCVTGGFGKGQLIVIGGRPGMGKTLLSLHMMCVMAKRQSVGSILFSADSKHDIAWIKRLYSLKKDKAHLINILDLNNLDYIRSECKRLQGTYGIVFVDYLQLIGDEYKNEAERIRSVLDELKTLAIQIDCPIVLLSQISRDTEKREDHRPVLSDLPQIGQYGKVEDFADAVFFIYRENYYSENYEDTCMTELILSKYEKLEPRTIELPFFMDFGLKTDGLELGSDDFEETVNLRIKRLRTENRMTQQELADRINVSSKTISKWESGRGLPEISLLVPLCRTLGITVDYLLDCRI